MFFCKGIRRPSGFSGNKERSSLFFDGVFGIRTDVSVPKPLISTFEPSSGAQKTSQLEELQVFSTVFVRPQAACDTIGDKQRETAG